MGFVRRRLIRLHTQQHLVVAVFVVLLSAAYTTLTPAVTEASQVTSTETGNPSVLIDTNKASRKIAAFMVPSISGVTDCRTEKCVALTFDDGPETATTNQVLDVLKREATPATFFVLGNKVAGHEAVLQRIEHEGHEIGNHSWAHPSFQKIKPEQMQAEIDNTNRALAQAGVHEPHIFRPPYGAINRKVLETVHMPIVLWNTDPHDWSAGTTPTQEATAVIDSVHAGSIVVMHDTKLSTAQALPIIIEGLEARGFKLVTVSQLLALHPGSTGVYYGF